MRKKEGMRQTDTKPLTRLITDEVEMINLHSTIWGTVHLREKYCIFRVFYTVLFAFSTESTVSIPFFIQYFSRFRPKALYPSPFSYSAFHVFVQNYCIRGEFHTVQKPYSAKSTVLTTIKCLIRCRLRRKRGRLNKSPSPVLIKKGRRLLEPPSL